MMPKTRKAFELYFLSIIFQDYVEACNSLWERERGSVHVSVCKPVGGTRALLLQCVVTSVFSPQGG